MRVMLTGAGGAGTTAVWRYLKDRYELYFADADYYAIPPVIPEERRVQIPLAGLEHFPRAVADACGVFGIDLLVPGVDEELLRLNRSGPLVMAPNATFVELALDKAQTCRILRVAGLDAARTGIDWPVVVKPKSGRGSRGLHIATSDGEINAWRLLYGEEPVVQERLIGTEYTVMVASTAGGELRAIVPVRIEKKRGITLRGVTERRQDIADYCEKLHRALGGNACYNVQLMACHDGRIAAFEINPRVSTTLCLGIAAGVDPIAIFLDRKVSTDWCSGLHLRRYWENWIA